MTGSVFFREDWRELALARVLRGEVWATKYFLAYPALIYALA